MKKIPRNAFVVGFIRYENRKYIDFSQIINYIIAKNEINVKAWFGDFFGIVSEYCYKYTTFYSNLWSSIYEQEINRYSDWDSDIYTEFQKNYFKIYYESYSRHDILENISSGEYIQIFNRMFCFIYGIFKKEEINLLIMDRLPHYRFDILFYGIAKILGIQIVCGFQIPCFYNRFCLISSYEDVGIFDTQIPLIFGKSQKSIKKTYIKSYLYMNNISFPTVNIFKNVIIKSLRFNISIMLKQLCMNYWIYCRKYEYIKILKTLKMKDFSNIKFIYFPLHLQPELTTVPLGGNFSDQLLAIKCLSDFIPDNWYIVVKENPKQDIFFRNKFFYDTLCQNSKVKLAAWDSSTFELIKQAQFVSTITGSVGFEAISGGKPVLIFGNAWYRKFPGVFEWRNNPKIDDILNCEIDHTLLEKNFSDLFNRSFKGYVDIGWCNEDNKNDNIIQVAEAFIKQIHYGQWEMKKNENI